MSLGRIVVAFVLVATLFNVMGWVQTRRQPDVRGAPRGRPRLGRPAIAVLTAEALVLTLLGALWFGSLGYGGWVLVFLFVGALATGAEGWIGALSAGSPVRTEMRRLALGLVKYLLAGALLAWRLG